jgi:ATP-dependent Clp protease adaptor protein ClpS
MNNTNIQEQNEVANLEALIDENGLVLYNDDINTFDHVINSLVKICKHEPLQAEQCAWVVHLNGKCKVKNGNYEELEPLCVALLDRGISASIE